MRIGAIRRDAIGPRQHGSGEIGHRHRVGAHIGALIVKDLVVDRENAPVAIDRGAHAMLLLARMIGGDQMLAAILDPFDRPLQAQRGDADQHVLRIDLAANAEAAADMPFKKVHRRRTAAEHARDLVPVPMRHLGGAVQFEHVAGGVIARDRAARLERHARMAADRQRCLDHRMRAAESGVDLAIALAHDRRLGGSAGLEFARRFVGLQNGRQFLDVERDELGRVLGEIGIVREHGGDRLADITHKSVGEEPLAIRLQALDAAQAEIDRRDVGDIGCGPHRLHAGQRKRRIGVDGAQLSVREIRAHDAHVQLLRK